jgi:chromate transporter
VSGTPEIDDRGAPALSGSPLEVLRVFLRLGLTSFGGPVAHLGYFREAFVLRLKWLDETAYADLVALCQFLPGPASSQVGFAIGLLRAGWPGALAAWAGFTLPSAIAMTLVAYGASGLTGPAGEGLLHGLKLTAVAIVAQAVLGMARSLASDAPRATIAVFALALTAFAPGAIGQIGAIGAGAVAGLVFCREQAANGPAGGADPPVSRVAALLCLAAYLALLGLAFLPARGAALAFLAAVYRSGALVFGGGHVVLPLLQGAVVNPGYVGQSAFLAGYGAAQAMPGPLFTFAAFLGAATSAPPGGAIGAGLALVAIFAPGLLILVGALPFWRGLRGRPGARAAMAGVNAAVVGLLAAALYDPVWTSAVRGPADFAIAAAGFVALVVWRAPPLAVVVLTAVAGIALGLAHG